MPHPSGSQGNNFRVHKSFKKAFNAVSSRGLAFRSTTGRAVRATQSLARDGVTEVIRFHGTNGTLKGNVCAACWGFRLSCTGTRIGQYVEALDRRLS
jgi:hypothetical protein